MVRGWRDRRALDFGGFGSLVKFQPIVDKCLTDSLRGHYTDAMTISVDALDQSPSFATLGDTVGAALTGDAPVDRVIEELFLVAVLTGQRGDVAEIAALRGRFARLLRRIKDDDSERAALMRPALNALQKSLDAARRAALLEDSARERDSEVRRLREAVLRLLRRSTAPLRPMQLAKLLDTDITQVSRALRELESERLVGPTDAPKAADRRGRWYRALEIESMSDDEAISDRFRRKAEPPVRYALRSLEHQLLARLHCREPLRRRELQQLTKKNKDELNRTLRALCAVGLVAERDDTYLLTSAGRQELFDLFKEGFAETVEAVQSVVPAGFEGALAIAGAPGSGKRSVAREVARRNDWLHLSIGTHIRARAFAEGISTEADVSAYGDALIAQLGWHALITDLVESGGRLVGDGPIVVDGFRFPEGLAAFRDLYSDVVALFLEAPVWMRELRLHTEQVAGFESTMAWIPDSDVEQLAAKFDRRVPVQGAELPASV